MNHSLIPLLKFHPEQPWPHREKEGYWGAKWDEGSGDQAHQSRPCQSRVRQKTPAPQPPSVLPSSHHSLAWCYKFIVHDRKLRTIIRGGAARVQGVGGGEWHPPPFSAYDLMQVKGEAQARLLSSLRPHTQISPFRYLLNLLRWNRCLYRNRLSVGQHTSFHGWQAMKGEREKRHNSKTIPDKCLETQQE